MKADFTHCKTREQASKAFAELVEATPHFSDSSSHPEISYLAFETQLKPHIIFCAASMPEVWPTPGVDLTFVVVGFPVIDVPETVAANIHRQLLDRMGNETDIRWCIYGDEVQNYSIQYNLQGMVALTTTHLEALVIAIRNEFLWFEQSFIGLYPN